jgi:hypothetical protein
MPVPAWTAAAPKTASSPAAVDRDEEERMNPTWTFERNA